MSEGNSGPWINRLLKLFSGSDTWYSSHCPLASHTGKLDYSGQGRRISSKEGKQILVSSNSTCCPLCLDLSAFHTPSLALLKPDFIFCDLLVIHMGGLSASNIYKLKKNRPNLKHYPQLSVHPVFFSVVLVLQFTELKPSSCLPQSAHLFSGWKSSIPRKHLLLFHTWLQLLSWLRRSVSCPLQLPEPPGKSYCLHSCSLTITSFILLPVYTTQGMGTAWTHSETFRVPWCWASWPSIF